MFLDQMSMVTFIDTIGRRKKIVHIQKYGLVCSCAYRIGPQQNNESSPSPTS